MTDESTPPPSTVYALLMRIDARLADIEQALAAGGVTLEAVKGLPDRVTKLEETTGTLRLIVFGFVATMILGLLGTVGGAVLWVISHGGGPKP